MEEWVFKPLALGEKWFWRPKSRRSALPFQAPGWFAQQELGL